MPEYLAPGVYIEEIATGPVPIEGVSTSTAGFVGPTERGPEYARLVTSWLDYQRWYGGYIPDQSYLAYAIQGFFANGGQRCFVSRIVSNSATAAQNDIGNLTMRAIGRGSWGDNVFVKVQPPGKESPIATETRFKLSIWYYRAPLPPDPLDPTDPNAPLNNPNWRAPDAFEQFDNLTDREGVTNNVVTMLNASSSLVRVAWNANGPAPLPIGDDPIQLQPATPGGDLVLDDFIGDLSPIGAVPGELLGRGHGLKALEAIDEISLLCVPDDVHPLTESFRATLRDEELNQCELLRDRFAILSVEPARSDYNNPLLNPPRDTSYGAFYYPWIEIFDQLMNERRLIPPTGHIAGIYARTDIERGVHKAPANEVVRGALNMEFPITKRDQDILNPRNVNCIRDFRPDGRSIRVWGARTMSSDGQWKYVNVRRLFIFVEESIDEGTQWVVFEPNDEPLWDRVRRSISNFLVTIWRNGALMGATQEEAFFVKCDRTTMTQDDIDNGRLICYIGLAPVKPAEFVIFRFSQKTLEAQS